MEPLEFTSVPPYGSNANLSGVVHLRDTEHLRIAIFIRVEGGWWTKPYWDSPATPISRDGSFMVSITTGGHDEQANEIAAFVIPEEYYPPGLRGEPQLPAELIRKALARAQVSRSPTVTPEPGEC